MKKLVLIRHAKAVDYGYEEDFLRKLNDRGKNDAQLVGNELKQKNFIPDLIISSHALRAKTTAGIMAELMDYQKEIILEEDIYSGMTTDKFIKLVRKTEDMTETLFVFGHNPDFEYFASNLQDKGSVVLPTCAALAIGFDIASWKEVEVRTGKTLCFIYPKMLN